MGRWMLLGYLTFNVKSSFWSPWVIFGLLPSSYFLLPRFFSSLCLSTSWLVSFGPSKFFAHVTYNSEELVFLGSYCLEKYVALVRASNTSKPRYSFSFLHLNICAGNSRSFLRYKVARNFCILLSGSTEVSWILFSGLQWKHCPTWRDLCWRA